MSAGRTPRSRVLSRRKFVSLLAAGSAAALAPADAVAAAAAARRKPVKAPAPKPTAPAPPAPSAEQKEFDRQRANTLAALKTIREFKLPPGGDLALVFRPMTSPRRGR